MDHHDFEIAIHPGAVQQYALHVRSSRPDSDADSHTSGELHGLDIERLRTLEDNPTDYGGHLKDALFASHNVLEAYRSAIAAAAEHQRKLRFRIFFAAGARDLARLRWETLRDPIHGTWLSRNQNVYFARLIDDSDWQRCRLLPKAQMKALVVLSNPRDITEYDLAPIEVKEYRVLIESALGEIPSVSIGGDSPATLTSVRSALRDGYDLLFVVCHGGFRDNDYKLFLQKEDGTADLVLGSDFAAVLRELSVLPRLAVLASCHSAVGSNVADTRPAHMVVKLAEAGVPAVVGMQSAITLASAATFLKKLFTDLSESGILDEAVAAARSEIADREDWWVPALFTRLKSARIWYVAGFTQARGGEMVRAEDQIWDSLIPHISDSSCTPIVGPGLNSPLVGSRRSIAAAWAIENGYPLGQQDRESLPRVAQFMARADYIVPRRKLWADVFVEGLRRLGRKPEKNISLMPISEIAVALNDLIIAYGEDDRNKDSTQEAFRVLARLPLKVYISTTYDDRLEHVLRKEGKDPVTLLSCWKGAIGAQHSGRRKTPVAEIEATVEHPIVYQLFGNAREPKSVVLTEDDYFDFLIGITKWSHLIPKAVTDALCDSTLLFLGHELDEWEFRVLFRMIVNRPGWEASGHARGPENTVQHVAATLDPEEGRIIEPERAKAYLKQYFTKASVEIFWGGADQFLRELGKRMAGVP